MSADVDELRARQCDAAKKHLRPIRSALLEDGVTRHEIGDVEAVPVGVMTRLERCGWCGWRTTQP